MKELKEYYVYILRCADDSLYTGITTNIEKRFNEHVEKRGAKYTKIKGVKRLEIYFKCFGRSDASKIEYVLKHINKEKKEELILDFKGLEEHIEKKLKIKIKKC